MGWTIPKFFFLQIFLYIEVNSLGLGNNRLRRRVCIALLQSWETRITRSFATFPIHLPTKCLKMLFAACTLPHIATAGASLSNQLPSGSPASALVRCSW